VTTLDLDTHGPDTRRVSVREVGPRDGFQHEPEIIPTETKVALIEALGRTGLSRMELTSFVSTDMIPQLADADDVLRAITLPAHVSRKVLVPNRRGLERALEQRPRFDELSGSLSATESHNHRSFGRSVEASLSDLELVIAESRRHGLLGQGSIAVSFGCPYEGPVDPERVFAIGRRLVAAGATEIVFGDTAGMANPRQVNEFFVAAREALGDEVELTAHFHNTRGWGLANVLAALTAGVRSFESSIGEIGGSPPPAGATGNIATEDLVSMLHEMGFETGIDLDALIACAAALQDALGRPLTSHTLLSGPIDWHGAAAPLGAPVL
jgi:hydroxymethylglutaryl-CoA lyase